MACSGICCAKCCTIFSFIGLIFLLIIASLLQTQPLYIKGPTDSAKAAAGCYQGALIYLGTLCLSIAYWLFDNARRKVSAALSGEPKSPVPKYAPVSNDNL